MKNEVKFMFFPYLQVQNRIKALFIYFDVLTAPSTIRVSLFCFGFSLFINLINFLIYFVPDSKVPSWSNE